MDQLNIDSLSLIEPVIVQYCPVCSMPFEYCEYAASRDECKTSLQQSDPELYSLLYLSSSDSPPVVPVKGGKRKEVEQKASQVIIKRDQRNKRKFICSVSGLETYSIDLKKASNKFATGSSVTKNPQGSDEIVIQGDVQDEVYDLILATWPQVPQDNISLVEGKTK